MGYVITTKFALKLGVNPYLDCGAKKCVRCLKHGEYFIGLEGDRCPLCGYMVRKNTRGSRRKLRRVKRF